MNGYARTARVLIREGHANVDAVNRISQTPLMYAVVEEHADTVRTILECGRPDLTLANELHWEWAPAHWAAIKVERGPPKIFSLAQWNLDFFFCDVAS